MLSHYKCHKIKVISQLLLILILLLTLLYPLLVFLHFLKIYRDVVHTHSLGQPYA